MLSSIVTRPSLIRTPPREKRTAKRRITYGFRIPSGHQGHPQDTREQTGGQNMRGGESQAHIPSHCRTPATPRRRNRWYQAAPIVPGPATRETTGALWIPLSFTRSLQILDSTSSHLGSKPHQQATPTLRRSPHHGCKQSSGHSQTGITASCWCSTQEAPTCCITAAPPPTHTPICKTITHTTSPNYKLNTHTN